MMIKQATSRRRVVAASCAALALQATASPAWAQAPAEGSKLATLGILAGGTTITVDLIDHASSRDLLRRLPMTVRMTRSGDREYHGRPGVPISADGPRQTRFDNGDLGYWAPGGYLAVFLDNTVRPQIADLIVLGRITSDLAAIKALGGTVEMTLERVEGVR